MRRIAILLTLTAVSLSTLCQKTSSLGLSLFSRYDAHAKYTTRYGNRAYSEYMKLSGLSNGATIFYREPVSEHLYIFAGLGYYALNVDRVRTESPWAQDIPYRTIDYTDPAGTEPAFSTKNYRYNNVNISVGLGYSHWFTSKSAFTFSGELNYLYTVSQVYQIIPGSLKYKRNIKRFLGFNSALKAGLILNIGRGFYLHPAVLLPVYQRIHQDRAFRENESQTMPRWFTGGGLSFTLGRYLK